MESEKTMYSGAQYSAGYPENPPPYASTAPPGPPNPYGPTVVHATVVPTAMPTVVPMVIGHQMSPKPGGMVCRSCHQQIITRVEVRPTLRTHLFAALLCLVGCWPCACLPYCVESCNNADHYCPNCNAYIGSYMH